MGRQTDLECDFRLEVARDLAVLRCRPVGCHGSRVNVRDFLAFVLVEGLAGLLRRRLGLRVVHQTALDVGEGLRVRRGNTHEPCGDRYSNGCGDPGDLISGLHTEPSHTMPTVR